MASTVFWFLFTVTCVYLQRLVPGVDLLVAGLVVSMQREKWVTSLWLGLAWILIQEGTGSLAFGSTLMRYALLALLFYLGRWLLQTTSLVFMVLLSLSLAVMHWIITQLMTELQDAAVNWLALTRDSLLQGVLFIIVWIACYNLYDKFIHVERQT